MREAAGSDRQSSRGWLMPGVVCAGGSLIATGAISPASLVSFFFDLGLAAMVVTGGAGLGITLLRLTVPDKMEARWQMLGGTGLGLGVLSLGMLGLGTLGVMHRAIWGVVMGAGAIAAALHVLRMRRIEGVEPAALRWLWVLTIPFLTIAILAVTLPPGILWAPEGNGYDVLEYHLGAPREYFDARQISYLPHNIYSNFPFTVEMLYLLCMIVRGDAVDAAGAAQTLHLLLGVLAVAAVWLAGAEHSPATGLFAGVSAAASPYMFYLSGLAYVENGLLLYCALSLAAAIRAGRAGRPLAWVALAGVFAGLACGCKYTGVYCIVVPLMVALACFGEGSRGAQLRSAVIFGAFAAIAFAPWMIRNTVHTGNPVFPLAREVFKERPGVWNDERAAHWHDGHLPAPQERSFSGRMGRLITEVLGSPMFGPTIAIGCAAGIALLWTMRDARAGFGVRVGLTMIAIGTCAWMFFTHLAGRFAVFLIIPAAIMLGIAMDRVWNKGYRRTVVVFVVLLATMNLPQTIQLSMREGLLPAARELAGFGTGWLISGKVPGTAHIPVLNGLAAEGQRVLMVGEARNYYLRPEIEYWVVFNRNPFAEACARGSEDAHAWLGEHGYRYLYVDWIEMARLRGSRYGFWPGITTATFEALLAKGAISVERVFEYAEGKPYATLFRVK